MLNTNTPLPHYADSADLAGARLPVSRTLPSHSQV